MSVLRTGSWSTSRQASPSSVSSPVSHERHGVRHRVHRVVQRHGRLHQPARVGGAHLVVGHDHRKAPGGVDRELHGDGGAAVHEACREAAEKRRGRVVGMAFEGRDDLKQVVFRERRAEKGVCGRGAARQARARRAEAARGRHVGVDGEAHRGRLAPELLADAPKRLQRQVVVAAERLGAAEHLRLVGGFEREAGVQREREPERIESRAEVGGRSGNADRNFHQESFVFKNPAGRPCGRNRPCPRA
jgi:hypothetical protein